MQDVGVDKRSASTIADNGGCATLIHPTIKSYVYSFSLPQDRYFGMETEMTAYFKICITMSALRGNAVKVQT